MKRKRLQIIMLLALAAMVLGACGSRNLFVASSWPGITVVEDTAYIAFEAHVYQVNVADGREVVRYPEEPERNATFFAPPAFAGDQMLVSGYNNTVVSVNPNTNDVNWSYTNSNRFVASPLVVGDLIVAPNSDHEVHALDFAGNEVWHFVTEQPVWATPMTDGQNIYIASMDHNLYAVDPESGQEVWRVNLGGTMVSSPALDDAGNLYVGSFNNQVAAVDGNGQMLWTFETQDWVWASPTWSDGMVYATDISGNVYALEADSGSQVWQYQAGSQISGSVLAFGESLYIGTQAGELTALSLEGVVRWSTQVNIEGAEILGSPVAAGDLILVGLIGVDPIDQVAIAFNQDGARVWEFVPQEK